MDKISDNSEHSKLLIVSNDKSYEVELNFIKDEISRRTNYNKSIINYQMMAIVVLLGTFVNDSMKMFDVNSYKIYVAILFINTFFLVEMKINSFYTKMSAIYLRYLNTKYVTENGRMIFGWEKFLDKQRTRNNSLFSFERWTFVFGSFFLMSIYLFLFSVGAFFYFLYSNGVGSVSKTVLMLFLFSSGTNLILIVTYSIEGLGLNKKKRP